MGDRARPVMLTHVGGPTLLVELGGWRLLTDPTFDPAGGHYAFGWGTSSEKVVGPALSSTELPDLGIDSGAAEILEEVVVQVHAVEGRVGRIDLVEIREVFIHEVRQGFG